MPSALDHPFLNLARERVVILDGAMGTSLHRYHPTDKDWGHAPNGKSLMNLSDCARLHAAGVDPEIHRGFLAAGCDGIETNTFNASQIVLDDFGMGDKLDEINRLNIRIAKEVVAEFTTPERPRFVIGSVGPGTKMPSLTDPAIYADFDRLADAYRPQIRVMIEERVDAILIETCFDVLQAKCVAITAIEEMKRAGVRLPLMVQLTIIDARQKMLPGTDIPAALVALDPLDEIDVLGMNCGVGPDLMLDGIRHLSRHSRKLLSVLPNAGLPETRGDETYFPLEPEPLAEWMERFVTEFGVNVIGGCCGTTSDHLAAVVARVGGKSPAKRTPTYLAAVSSLQSLAGTGRRPEAPPRRRADQHQRLQEVQATPREGGLARPRRDGQGAGTRGRSRPRRVRRLRRPRRRSRHEGGHQALQRGADEADHARLDRSAGHRGRAQVCAAARRSSTRSTSRTAARRSTRRRGSRRSTARHSSRSPSTRRARPTRPSGSSKSRSASTTSSSTSTAFPPSDLLFDPLVFPVSTGQEQTRKSALATFEGIRLIKQNLPGALTHLGLSNCSFGLAPYTRQVLNSVYLHYALEYGLDSAILHAAKIMPLASHRREGEGDLPAAPVRRARLRRGGQLHRRPAADAHRALRRQEGREQEGTVARRDGGGTPAPGDHPGPARDAHRRPRRGARVAIRRSTSSTRSCSTA